MRRALRQAECFTMPMECLERICLTKPCARLLVIAYGNLTPADFFDRVVRHHTTHGLGHQLPAETMPQHRNIVRYRIIYQRQQWRYPRQVIIDTHRSAHEHQSAIITYFARHYLTGINTDELPRNRLLIQKVPKISRPFCSSVAKDGDRFHAPISSIN